MSLQRLDDRVLPQAAARLRRAVDAADAARGSVLARWQDGARRVRGLPYGEAPVLRTLRRQPVAAAVVAALLVVAAVGVAVWRDGGGTARRSHAGELQPQTGGLGVVLGPKAGMTTQQYTNDAMAGLVAAVRTAPGTPRVALVSLADYRTPEQAAALLTGFTPSRVFLRAKDAGSKATPLPIDIHGPLLPQLRRAYADTARTKQQAAAAYQGYVDIVKGTTAREKAYRALYAAFAVSARIEAKDYANHCACVYAVVVTATPAQLLTLESRPGVRAVEVAPAGLTALQVQTQPLLPEIVGVVPRPRPGGGGG